MSKYIRQLQKQVKKTQQELQLAVLLTFLLRASSLVLAYFADRFLAYQPSFPYADTLAQNYQLPRWIYSFAGFDGVHYLTIVEKGYVGTGLIQAFFPVWPYLLRFGSLFGNTIVVGLIIQFFLTVGLFYVWQLFIKAIYPQVASKTAFFVLALWPTSLFFFALYSETLFLLLICSAFLAAHHKNWKVAVLVAAIASATRIVGVLLVPALMFEFWMQQEKGNLKTLPLFIKKHWQQLCFLSLGSLGLLAYMAYLYFQFGDPLLFKTVQSQWGHQRSDQLILYPQVVWRYAKSFLKSFKFELGWWTIAQEAVVGVVTPWLPFVFKEIRLSHLLFGLSVTLVPTLTGTFSSLPRYILANFPIFIAVALLISKYPKSKFIWFALSTFILICNTILFIQGYWVA